MKKMKFFVQGAFFSFYLVAIAVIANAINVTAKQALLIDLSTDTVLYEKNADELMDPSSMSKIMLVYDVLERLKDGRLKLEDTFLVSEKAWRKGGSSMFVELGTQVSIADLLKGIIIQSGNDASIVVAEGLSGSEEAYAEYLTERSHELGAKTATFKNATGWPVPGHKMSARDLSIIARRTMEDFPTKYKLYAEKSFTYNKIKQGNRNPLLYDTSLQASGMKTGASDEGGFGLIGSVEQDGRRLLFVINGCSDKKKRAQDARTLVKWGLREFVNVTLAQEGKILGKVEIIDGQMRFIEVIAPQNLEATIQARYKKSAKLEITIEPIKAPIFINQEIGVATLNKPNGEVLKTWPLYSRKNVEKLGFFGRIWQNVMRLLLG